MVRIGISNFYLHIVINVLVIGDMIVGNNLLSVMVTNA